MTTREPDFDRILKVLRREPTDSPVLFEMILNERLARRFNDGSSLKEDNRLLAYNPWWGSAFTNLGYDYWMGYSCPITFNEPNRERDKSIGMAHGGVIATRKDFDAFPWPDPEAFDYSLLDSVELPGKAKMVIMGPGGVLENITSLVGFEDLCFMLIDEPELASDIFEKIGSILLRYYTLSMPYKNVGAGLVNDDWGFKSQTMLPPEQMREYVIPWHKKMVEAIHASGRPAIMHSCGKLDEVMEDIIEDIGFDGKHSYEDGIHPVEEVFPLVGNRMAVLGGLDVDFMVRATPEEIRVRADALLDQTAASGGYALGTGNSVPEYIPDENYLAMIDAARNRW